MTCWHRRRLGFSATATRIPCLGEHADWGSSFLLRNRFTPIGALPGVGEEVRGLELGVRRAHGKIITVRQPNYLNYPTRGFAPPARPARSLARPL